MWVVYRDFTAVSSNVFQSRALFSSLPVISITALHSIFYLSSRHIHSRRDIICSFHLLLLSR